MTLHLNQSQTATINTEQFHQRWHHCETGFHVSEMSLRVSCEYHSRIQLPGTGSERRVPAPGTQTIRPHLLLLTLTERKLQRDRPHLAVRDSEAMFPAATAFVFHRNGQNITALISHNTDARTLSPRPLENITPRQIYLCNAFQTPWQLKVTEFK